jgi:phosphatidylglycerol:prolipoprotein diacylglycerol transferase
VIPPLLIPYPHFNPVAFALGPVKVHWYGIMYIIGFFAEYHMLKWQSRFRGLSLDDNDIGDFIGHLILGVVLGGRLGYVLLYNPAQYFAKPWEVFFVWNGGMAFHGGLVGTIVAGWWWCRKKGVSFPLMADLTAVGAPIGLALGRFGNFINAELWGRPTDVPWAMAFPTAPDGLPRHPSQLYEMLLEGFFLLTALVLYSRRKPPEGALFGIFLAGYGIIRFIVELFRNPDAQFITETNPTGAVFGPFSMGQTLSLPMILIGLGVVVAVHVRAAKQTPKNPLTQIPPSVQ